MAGVVAFEGDLNAIVKEYLEFNTLKQTAEIFEKECVEKDKPIEEHDSKPKVDEKLVSIQNDIMRAFDKGQRDPFVSLWTKNIPEKIRSSDATAQNIEFFVHVYFAIYPIKHKTGREAESMDYLKEYLTKMKATGNSKNAQDLIPFYALPFVPRPETNPSYKELFTDKWEPDLRLRLHRFVTLTLDATAQPRLFELYKGGSRDIDQKLQERDRKVQAYQKRCSRVQQDYHNLIGITADLIDSLENSLQGRPISPEKLNQVCLKLFSSQVRESVDLTRPGTAGEVLRKSVNPAGAAARNGSSSSKPSAQQYDYDKLKRHLIRASDRTKSLIMQALRWKLTKTTSEERDLMMAAFVQHDVLGCLEGSRDEESILSLLDQKASNQVRHQAARLLNTVSSLVEGRSYLSKNRNLVPVLVYNLQDENLDMSTREHILGCLQKLSLRRPLQSQMIEAGCIDFLVNLLADNDELSDYSLEYATALTMNLCLRSKGKKKCVQNAGRMLQVISDLLGHENADALPYVNGTLYSILGVSAIREEALKMDLKGVLEQHLQPNQPEMNRQLEFIIGQLDERNEEPEPADSDDENDEEDEESDTLEADLDNNDPLKPQSGESSGDALLLNSYSQQRPSSSRRTRRPTDSVAMQEDVLRRPVTPNRFKGGGDSTALVQHQPSSRPTSGLNRPPTRSGSRGNSRHGSRPGTTTIDTAAHGSEYPPPSTPGSSNGRRHSSNSKKSSPPSPSASAYPGSSSVPRPSQSAIAKVEKNGGKYMEDEYMQGFASKRAIPRTPAGAPPRPEYSDGLPTSRPNSGSSRPNSSQGSKQTAASPRGPRTPKGRSQNQ